MGGDVRQIVRAGRQRRGDDFKIRTAEQRRLRSDDCVVGSGKTEDAMSARSLAGRAGREGRSGRGAVHAQLKARRIVFMGGERKAAKRDEKALHGDSIGDDDPDERSPKSLGPSAKSSHVLAYSPNHITGFLRPEGRNPGYFGRMRIKA
jgi:hypothetical protein